MSYNQNNLMFLFLNSVILLVYSLVFQWDKYYLAITIGLASTFQLLFLLKESQKKMIIAIMVIFNLGLIIIIKENQFPLLMIIIAINTQWYYEHSTLVKNQTVILHLCKWLYIIIRDCDKCSFDTIFVVIQLLGWFSIQFLEQKEVSNVLSPKFQSILEDNSGKMSLHSKKISVRQDFSQLKAQSYKNVGEIESKEDKFQQIVEFNPDGVLIIQSFNDMVRINYSNETIKKLFQKNITDDILKSIGKLKNLTILPFKQHDNSQSPCYFIQKLNNNNNTRPNRAQTNLENNHSIKMIADPQNHFEKQIYSAFIYMNRRDVQKYLKNTKTTFQVFSILNGYLESEQEDQQTCLEIKIYISKIQMDSQLLVVVRDVSHRDYIKMLKQQSIAKQNSLNFVSHEYRTPLNCIITMLENTEQSNQNEYLQIAIQNCYYLLNLSNDLLALGQMKVGKFKLTLKRFNLNQLLKQCLQMFSIIAAQKNITLDLQYKYQHNHVESDENRIKQIIINLLGNAFKFTLADGSITVLVEEDQFNLIKISVIDNGIGIKEEEQGKLIQAFSQSQSDESKKLNQNGVGLGLLISSLIAQSLNGQGQGLLFESTYKKGSTFYFHLDINHQQCTKIAIEDEVNLKVSSEAIQPVYKTKAMKRKFLVKEECKCNSILIVDDIQVNIQALIILIKKRGYDRIDFVLSGEFAIQQVKEKMNNKCCPKYDLIFMDLEMPGLDGYSTFDKLNELEYNVPIVACSGYQNEKEKQKCKKKGFVDYLEKPLQRNELDRILNKYIGI